MVTIVGAISSQQFYNKFLIQLHAILTSGHISMHARMYYNNDDIIHTTVNSPIAA